MISRKVWIIFIAGIVIVSLLILTAAIRFLFPQLPEGFKLFSSNLQSTFYWSIPLILIIFISPYVHELSRRPDIDFIFQNRGDGNLLVTVVNRGDTAFSFNRIQFYVRKPRMAKPEDGKTTHLWFRKAGVTIDYEMREDAGCTIERGIPLIFWTQQKYIYEWLSHIREKAPNKPIYCRIYFEGTHMEAKSKQPLLEKLVNELIKTQ